MSTEKETLPDFKLRLPRALKDQIEAASRSNNRSLNKEIVSRLEASFRGQPASAPDDLEKRLEKIERRLDTLKECLDEKHMGPLPEYWD